MHISRPPVDPMCSAGGASRVRAAVCRPNLVTLNRLVTAAADELRQFPIAAALASSTVVPESISY